MRERELVSEVRERERDSERERESEVITCRTSTRLD